MKKILTGRKTRPIWLYNEKELFCSDFISNYIGGRVDRLLVVCYNDDAATKKKGGKEMRTKESLKKTIKHWTKTFCENFLKFLKDKSGCIGDVPKKEMKSIAEMLLPNIIAFYETEEGKRVFEEWKKKREEKASADVA